MDANEKSKGALEMPKRMPKRMPRKDDFIAFGYLNKDAYISALEEYIQYLIINWNPR